MSFTIEMINDMIDDDNHIIHDVMARNDFYDLQRGIRYYEFDYLEDYNHRTDIDISFNYLNDELLYDGYFRINPDGTLRFKYCTKTEEHEEASVFRIREFDNIRTIEELMDIIENQIYHLLWVSREVNDDGLVMSHPIELKF